MSILQKLTEGVQSRDMQAEGAALLNKWEATGLLEGLNEGTQKQGMAVLLENQAKELLREASSMAAGDVEGFAAVAFPIVRRVFGGLIANDLVSVQPMSLPSGLIFFLDFTHATSPASELGARSGESVYGGNVVGSEITGGVNLDLAADNVARQSPGGFYDFGNAASHATGSATLTLEAADPLTGFSNVKVQVSALSETQKKALDFDPDILALTGAYVQVARSNAAHTTAGQMPDLNTDHLGAIGVTGSVLHRDGNGASEIEDLTLVRRLTKIDSAGKLQVVMISADNAVDTNIIGETVDVKYPRKDNFRVGSGLGSVVGGDTWGLEGASNSPGDFDGVARGRIAEIDIKVDSIAVTAQTKKLKAKWTPELGQDLNAYHNLDAEVELTGILSEQIALEIDRELLQDLVRGATAGTRYWSRAPGLFVDSSGAEIGASSAAPDFTGTVSEWYETLIETINDVSAQIHRKTLRGGANFVVCSPEVANILEFTSGFRASVTADQDRGTIGAIKAGSLSKKFDVYVDPYFIRNVLLVGRKGSSFLESGFVYAPYVPLQVTPTIFGTEDFVPRKGVMTRYAKKMVRPDMYGLVVVRGLLGEAGKTA